MNPAAYRLPYPKLREHQLESIQWVAAAKPGTPQIGEMPVGSGKSPVAMAQAIYGSVIVVTKSKNLQVQYGDLFPDCAVLFGRPNYPCVHHARSEGETAADCRFGQEMHKCHYHDECPYVVAKNNARAADRVALNYWYWLTTGQKWQPHTLVLDEAHNLSDMVLDWVGTTINLKDRERWSLPDFPGIEARSSSPFLNQQNGDPAERAIEWLHTVAVQAENKRIELEKRHGTETVLRQRRGLESFARQISSTIEALETKPGDHWYIRSGADRFVCKPLTARFDAPRFFFTNRPKVLCMSATIGDPQAFSKELGIKEYDFRWVPNQFSPQERPVRILDCPSMGHAATEKNPASWDKQADEIAKAIKSIPSAWSGLILVTRKREASLLAERLARRGLQDRVWVTPGADAGSYVATQEQVRAWDERRTRYPNSICISWSLWSGYDGTEEHFVFAAKVPFDFIAEDYARERMYYNQSFFLQRAAYELEQGLGRTRRGVPEDYDSPEEGIVRGYVAIADGSWTRIKKYISKSLQESLVY